MGIDFYEHIAAGRIDLQQVDPAQIPPGQLAHNIVRAVTQDNTRVVVLDSLLGDQEA